MWEWSQAQLNTMSFLWWSCPIPFTFKSDRNFSESKFMCTGTLHLPQQTKKKHFPTCFLYLGKCSAEEESKKTWWTQRRGDWKLLRTGNPPFPHSHLYWSHVVTISNTHTHACYIKTSDIDLHNLNYFNETLQMENLIKTRRLKTF